MPKHLAEAIQRAGGSVERRSKYGARKTNGYDSAAEAKYAAQLQLRMNPGGDVAGWVEQYPITFASGVTYKCDFLVFLRDGTWKLVEVKGFETPEFKLKMKLLEHERPDLRARLEIVR